MGILEDLAHTARERRVFAICIAPEKRQELQSELWLSQRFSDLNDARHLPKGMFATLRVRGALIGTTQPRLMVRRRW